MRRRLAPLAGLALLLAGGALVVRVTVLGLGGDEGGGVAALAWLAAAAACILAGVALVAVALPKIASPDPAEPPRAVHAGAGAADEPSPELPRG